MESMNGRTLWCVQENGAVIEGHVEYHGAYGVEVQLLWDGLMYFSELFPTEREAVSASDQFRRRLITPRKVRATDPDPRSEITLVRGSRRPTYH
jgi:hypothetical protein